ncbi:STAS domain-containing protein [Prosthecobacter vanneervenii]|uniref:Anti-sigma factor antagonist n=1 Tax=Prosthecobacter vanneervenii TaxID=48466 RepID=A0A7W7YD07_9BACT|nr:STAS domain-containing protein [Prosthecobacter vanneervenii]MBB5033923.1 anti-anti-sigma factor [Prosthecobacter vanneervenii]
MEISRQTSGDLIILRLAGRLDANWCNHVESALSATVRDGEHRLHLDMSAVSYISSAGIRVLLACHKQLRAINGLFGVIRPSEAVRSVLELSGLQMLITSETVAAATEDAGKKLASPSAAYELFPLGGSGMKIETVGEPATLARGCGGAQPTTRRFDAATVALGVGALGGSFAENAARCGELLAVAGVAAFQPADGSSRPDFMLSEGALVPEGQLVLGLSAQGSFSSLLRFEANDEDRRSGLTELMQTALESSGANAAVVVAVTETAGLVGASLRQSPASEAGAANERFGFPQIRDWLSFTSERSFRDSTSLVVGVIARPGSAFDALLRPLARGTDLLGHLHAAVFPYRPLRKGRIDLQPAVTSLFDGQALQSVLHLISDPRGFNGAGESEFYRGAVWTAPIIT